MAHVVEEIDQQAQRLHFDALVRGLCNSLEMRKHLDTETSALHHKQTHAPAALAALAKSVKQQPYSAKTNTILRLESASIIFECSLLSHPHSDEVKPDKFGGGCHLAV